VPSHYSDLASLPSKKTLKVRVVSLLTIDANLCSIKEMTLVIRGWTLFSLSQAQNVTGTFLTRKSDYSIRVP
jgi:hypothetical protein